MRKYIKILFVSLILIFIVSCSAINNVKNMFSTKTELKYHNITATFVTTQGEISFYLYPEAAPINVANFINLSKRGFYNNNKIIREVQNFVLQSGDPTGTGKGNTGYNLPDEKVNWLNFFKSGMLAMASYGPNTASSQYFFTLYPTEWLNGQYTIFGEVKSEKDFELLRKLEYGDVIKEIRIEGNNVDKFMSVYKVYVDQWNYVLDKNFANLKPYKVEEASIETLEEYKEELKNIYKKDENKKEMSESIITKLLRSTFNKIDNYEPKEVIVNQNN